MIRLTDAALLAYTKLRARKVRLIVTVIISSLLFGVLALSSFVVRGAVKSVGSFAEEGFGKRYLLIATPTTSAQFDPYTDKSTLDRAIALQKDQIAHKKAEAKRLGIEYDPTTERPVYLEGGGPGGKERYLDTSNALAIQAVNEYYRQHPIVGLPELKKISRPYQPVGVYQTLGLSLANPNTGVLKVLQNGQENFDQNKPPDFNPFNKGLDTFTNSWSLMSGGLLKTFTLDSSDGTKATKDGVLPIVAPYTAVEQLLNLKPLPGSATTKARLDRLEEVRTKAPTISFDVCYRNPASSELINQAQNVKREIEQNKNNKDYQKPKLIYDIPTEPCGPARIVRDVRSADEKYMDSKQQEFRRIFGEEAPMQSILKFQVIGVAPDPPDFNAAFLDGLMSQILSSNIGSNWYTPLELHNTNPLLTKLFPDANVSGQPANYIIELPSAAAAKRMLDEANCDLNKFTSPPVEPSFMGSGPQVIDLSPQEENCIKTGKVFFMMPYGSSSVALADFQKGFSKIFRIAAIVVTIIAALIMMGTVGRIIADARRETAVFRAIGAKRLDLAQVYVTYALIISLLIGICAIIAGFVLSQIAQARWGSQFTMKALVAYNARDLSRQFHLYAWYGKDLLYILLAALSAGLISTVFPLLRNLRRNPINDMRDEN